MKKILTLVMTLVLSASLYASFPVNKKNAEKAVVEQTFETTTVETQDVKVDLNANVSVSAEDAISPAVSGGNDTMIITLLLWFVLGGLAAHRWYKKKPTGWNILFILTLGGLGIWWIVDGINILTDNF